jgi:hypothetical protein
VRLRQRLISVLALATLGNAKVIGSFLFFVAPPKVAKVSTIVTVGRVWLFQAFCLKNIYNVTEPLSRLSVLTNEKERIEKTKSFK